VFRVLNPAGVPVFPDFCHLEASHFLQLGFTVPEAICMSFFFQIEMRVTLMHAGLGGLDQALSS